MDTDLLTSALIEDGVRYVHLLSVAIGIGASFFADLSVFQNVKKPVSDGLLDTLSKCHRVVWAALIVMWISGVAMIYLRTNFILADFSPKLYTKILVVSILAINAILIGEIAQPALARMLGRSPLEMPLRMKLPLATMAGVSTLSWLFALALGSSKFLAQGGSEMFYTLVMASYGTCLVVAVGTAVALHMAMTSPSDPHSLDAGE